MTFWLHFVAVLIVAAIVDACWAFYLRRAGEGAAIKAANWAFLLLAFGMFNTKSWLDDLRFAPAMLVGAWAGTFLTVRHDHTRKAKP